MRFCNTLLCLAVGVVGVGSVARAADEAPKAAEPGTLIVLDQAGKEHKLKSWKFTVGTRRLSWLAPTAPKEDKEKPKDDKDREKPKDKEKDKEPVERPAAPAGPEALEFREENSTNYAKGILTFVPLDRIRAIDYDPDKESVTVRVAVSDKPEEDEQLTGATKFQGENKLTIEAEVDKGDMGVAEVKFLAGIPKGIRGLRFAPPKVPAGAAGRPAQITSSDKKDKATHKASDMQALYRLPDGSLRLHSTLLFKKTLKADLAKVKKLVVVSSNPKEGAECTVTFKDGEEHTLTLLRTMPLDEKPAALEGLLGKVKAGYKLFPIHTIAELQFDEAEEKK